MKARLLGLLVCPHCYNRMEPYALQMEDGEIKDGIMKCLECDQCYPIVNFIPRLLPSSLYRDTEFIDQYQDRLGQLGITTRSPQCSQDSLARLKADTIKRFGFEWLEYGRFGWDDPVFNIEREEKVFRKKSLLDPQDLQGKLVLDAGCGNGRYSYWAAQYGAEVVGVDLGYGVESAYTNTKNNKDIHIIQGDIFNLPFPEETFDVIFSIGVLMHTGDARLALMSLTKHLKMEGVMSFHLYHKGNPIYEFNDFILRKITTRLSVGQLVRFTRLMFRIAKILDKVSVLKYVNLLIRLEKHPHCIFDWYSAPIATHHTYSEVYEWCRELGLRIVKDANEEKGPSFRRKVAPPGSLTMRAVKS